MWKKSRGLNTFWMVCPFSLHTSVHSHWWKTRINSIHPFSLHTSVHSHGWKTRINSIHPFSLHTSGHSHGGKTRIQSLHPSQHVYMTIFYPQHFPSLTHKRHIIFTWAGSLASHSLVFFWGTHWPSASHSLYTEPCWTGTDTHYR